MLMKIWDDVSRSSDRRNNSWHLRFKVARLKINVAYALAAELLDRKQPHSQATLGCRKGEARIRIRGLWTSPAVWDIALGLCCPTEPIPCRCASPTNRITSRARISRSGCFRDWARRQNHIWRINLVPVETYHLIPNNHFDIGRAVQPYGAQSPSKNGSKTRAKWWHTSDQYRYQKRS